MWVYVLRRVLYNAPVYLAILLVLFVCLRVYDPVYARVGKNPTPEVLEQTRESLGLDQPAVVQYLMFLGQLPGLAWDTTLYLVGSKPAPVPPGADDDTIRSWDSKEPVSRVLARCIPPTLKLTVPALLITTLISTAIGLVSAFNRGRRTDRFLMIAAVVGMCVSFLVYIILGQKIGAYDFNEFLRSEFGIRQGLFAISGYQPGLENWAHYCLLPVLISVIVAMGYDTRFYRAVMVEECNRDYIVTAQAKGATNKKIMFVHMLKNAMIPIITRVMITLPFLITGSFLLEMYFSIPGMGATLIHSILAKDLPVVQCFTAVFAGLFIATNILTDVLYALVDPRVRLS